MRSRTRVVLVLLFVTAFGLARGVDAADSRRKHVHGVYLSLLGDPYPTATGLTLAYNLWGTLRLTMSGGTLTAGTFNLMSSSVGLKAFVPGWDFSPFIGIGYNAVVVNASSVTVNNVVINTSPGINLNTATLSFGLDWQSEGGFLLGFSYAIPIGNATWTGINLPGLYIGYMFL